MNNRVTQLLNIELPIIQAGMIWCSGWKLAAAVTNAGGLGIIGSGSMYPDVLRNHIRQCKEAVGHKTFGVNVPLMYPDIDKHMAIIAEEQVPVVFSSAGNPKKWTTWLKEKGIKVIHVVPGARFAQKAQDARVDAVVAEGFEAGGHNGREETTTMCLIPAVCKVVEIPVIAAGGIGTGAAMAAAFALGAEGVQVGSRFVATVESSANDAFKQVVVGANEGDTLLTMKQLTPVRLVKNAFFQKVIELESRCGNKEEMQALLGRGRAKQGMFEGNLEEGELEIGQVSALITEIKPAAEVVQEIWNDFLHTCKNLSAFANKVGS